jgi:hypothetical protein
MAEFTRFELKEFDTSTLSGTFQNLGSALAHAAKYAQFFNTSTVDVYVTVDGTNNAFRVPANSNLPVPSYPQHNANNDGAFVFKKGTQLKVKQVSAAAAGAFIAHIFT